MGVALPFVFKAVAAYAIGVIAGRLLSKDKRATIDNKKPTLASRGDFVPLLIGTRSLSPIVLWVGDRTTTSEGHAGGKGVTGGGGSQLVYRESSWHAICVGPARRLKRIRENGKPIWEATDTDPALTGGITPETHPSGSTISVSGHGSFRIFWGEADQPVNTRLGDPTRVGFNSRHKFLCYVEWIQKRLGGSATWAHIEYEIECHPFKTNDTYAYTGAYDGRGGLPERLSQSVGWMQNGIGATDDPIPILTAEDGDPGTIKLQGNVIDLAATSIRIQNNSALADGDYGIATTNYNPSEVLRVPSGVYLQIPGSQADFDTWTIGTGVTSVSATTGLAMPPGANPFIHPDNTIYRVDSNPLWLGEKDLEIPIAGLATNMALSPGVNHVRLWVRGFNYLNFVQFSIELFAYDHPSLGDNTHRLDFFSDHSGFPTVLSTNGPYGTIESVGQSTPGGGPSQDWWQVDFYYRSGTGTSPSDQNWKRTIRIKYELNGGGSMFLYANDGLTSPHNREYAFLSDDDGTLITGITTVETVEPLTGSNYDAGEMLFLILGAGHDGANIAHTLDQLLFESVPHGQGLDRSLWDIDSLEEVGVAMGIDGEGLRTHVLVDDGSTLEGVVANILVDAGLTISWDPVQGKYAFKMIRDPGITPVVTIPALALNAPLPEITTILDAGVPDKKIYMFPDRDLNYRPSPADSTDDDGRSSREDRQNAQKDELYIVTDVDAANQIASRREQYDMSPPSIFEMEVGRAARRLVPGIPVFVEGIEERLRLMEVGPVENTSMRVKVKAATDVYR